MTEKEYLLTCLVEELNEMAQAISKCLRFGPHHIYEGYSLDNLEKVCEEYSDVEAILGMLGDKGIDITCKTSQVLNKISKTTNLIQRSRELGIINDNRNN